MTKRVRIIGAGFSGLTLAYYLKKRDQDIEIAVIEAEQKVGGLLQTTHSPYGLAELSANSLLDTPTLRGLCADVGIELESASAGISRGYFLRTGRLRRWPLSLLKTLTFGLRVIRFFLFKNRYHPQPMETLAHWGERTFGFAFTHSVLAGAIAGIYAAPPEQLSASLILNRFFKPASNQGPRRKLSSVIPRQGMHSLCTSLKLWLETKSVRFELGKKDTVHLEKNPDGIKTIFCGSLNSAKEYLKSMGISSIQNLSSLPVSSCTVFFKNVPIKAPCTFGVLFPRAEGRPYMGALLNQRIFPHHNPTYSETWIAAGTDITVDKLVEERARYFDSTETPLLDITTRWPEGIPLYGLVLEEFLTKRWPEERAQLAQRGFYLHGNYLGSLGLSKILLESEKLAHEI